MSTDRLAALVERLEDVLETTCGESAGVGSFLIGCVAGGKRLRGRLALVPVAALDLDPRAALRYAAFVELIQTGTLCHDDVVDRCEMRRGRPSVVAAAGSRAAAMAGMVLIWRAYALVAEDTACVRQEVARAAARVAKGQLDEIADAWVEVPVGRYLERQREKTGALFELAAWLGARAAGLEPATTDALVSFARHAGLAFQIADDIRDVTGGPELGRPPGADLREGTLTLPVLLALADPAEASDLRRMLAALERGDEGSLRACRRRLLAGGYVEQARAVLRETWVTASDAVRRLPAGRLRAAVDEYATWIGAPDHPMESAVA